MKKKGSAIRKTVRENIQGWLVVGPVILYYLIFGLYPLYILFKNSVYSQRNMFSPMTYVGLGNFVDIFTKPEYYNLLLNTTYIALFTIGISFFLGLLLAHLFTAKIKGTAFFRTVFYIPVVVSMAVVSQIVNVWLSPTHGTLNNLFGTDIQWTQSVFWMYFWLIVICIWKGLGATVILYVAGLSSISPEMYEAAEIDGAGRISRFFHISMPLLRPMHVFVLITSIIGAFNIFEPVQLITKGGPDGKTKVVMFMIYDEAIKNGNMGMGSALSIVILLILMGLTALNMRFGTEKADVNPKRR